MKKIICRDCGGEFQATTREEILNILYDHYMKDHREIITGATDEAKKAWMEQFEKDWTVATEK